MDLSFIINKSLSEISTQLNKEPNKTIIQQEILNPLIKHIITELYPYVIKILIIIFIIFIFILVTMFLNIRIVLSY